MKEARSSRHELIKQEIGKRLREYRMSNNLNFRQLFIKNKYLHPGRTPKLERGELNAFLDFYLDLCAVYGITLSDLFAGVEEVVDQILADENENK